MMKKKKVVAEVLDADHLVVGVDAEVVLPARRAVGRVILRSRLAAERVVDPVVERAETCEEAERHRGQERDNDDDLPLPERMPARVRAEADDDARPDRPEQRHHPRARIQPGAVSLRRPVGGGEGAWSCVGGMPVRLDVGHFAPFEESTRKWTRASSCGFGRDAKVCGITFGGIALLDVRIGFDDRLSVNGSSGCPACCAYRQLIEIGPDLPGARRGLQRVARAAPVVDEDRLACSRAAASAHLRRPGTRAWPTSRSPPSA